MKITQIESILVGRSIFVRVHTDAGISGIGECSPMNAPVIAAHVEHSLAPLFLGEDPTRVEWLVEKAATATYTTSSA